MHDREGARLLLFGCIGKTGVITAPAGDDSRPELRQPGAFEK
jgi:hypothetical protein